MVIFIKKNKISKLTIFLIKLFISFLLFFIIIILDYYEIVNYKNIKYKLSDNINFLEIFDKFIGDANIKENIINTNESINVNEFIIYEREEKKGEYIRRYLEDEFYVILEASGIVTKIDYQESYYYVEITDYYGNIHIYNYLTVFNYNIYQYIECGNVIGECINFYDYRVIKNEN